ncbi:hypothetical protein I6I97_17450 [Sphingobacterium multivorum]|uniref:hypothetical protein n=1 Tax=Sphingobacterium multivorum TaxID=28454 RepID=UPI00191A8615|nr:hypothetical protein [Sphingobacterium multivorum]QQT60987.1 hypothetical protein I6I97_17450 [Sphingobacterium multivorum]
MDNLEINKPLEDMPGEVGDREQGVHVSTLYVACSSSNGAISEPFSLFGMKWLIHS